MHAELLERYSAGAASLADVPDDGYFLQVRRTKPFMASPSDFEPLYVFVAFKTDELGIRVATVSERPKHGVQAVGHHCMGANQAPLLERLLSQPEWLHNKLRAYGVASLVSDFRRCCLLMAKAHPVRIGDLMQDQCCFILQIFSGQLRSSMWTLCCAGISVRQGTTRM